MSYADDPEVRHIRERARLVTEIARLRELLRRLAEWAESPPVKAVEQSAFIHGVKYRPEDVAIWNEVRALSPATGREEPKPEIEMVTEGVVMCCNGHRLYQGTVQAANDHVDTPCRRCDIQSAPISENYVMTVETPRKRHGTGPVKGTT